MTVKKYSEIVKEDWDSFVQESPDGWIYQLSSSIDFMAKDQSVLKNLSFMLLSKTGEPLFLIPLFLTERVKYSGNRIMAFIQKAFNFVFSIIFKKKFFRQRVVTTFYTGFAMKSNTGKRKRRKNIKEFLSYVDAQAEEVGASFVEIRNTDVAPVHCPSSRSTFNLMWNYGYDNKLTESSRLFSYVDLTKTQAEIKSDLEQKCRSEIHKAERLGVSFIDDCQSDLDSYFKIHEKSWQRTAGWNHEKKFFSDLVSIFPEECSRFFFAEYDGQKVAAVLLHFYKGSVFYYGGSSLDDAKKCYANNFLLYNAILWAKNNGSHTFGVGLFESFPGSDSKEYSVGRYKTQFSSLFYPALEGRKMIKKK